MLVTIEKEPSEYFQQLHFQNQWVPLIKMHCRVRYLFDFDQKSAQARCVLQKRFQSIVARASLHIILAASGHDCYMS